MLSWRKKARILRKALASTHTPRFASLFVTRKCNLHCAYCRSRDQDFPDLDLESWRRIIDRLHGWGVRHFSLTGGEPLLRKDICPIISHISKQKKSLCWLITNGKLLTRGTLDALSGAGLDFITCSMDSLEENDDKNGRSVLSLLEYAREQGIVPACLAVVTNRNLAAMPALLEAATRRGILFDMGLYQNVGGLFSPEDDGLKVKDRAALEEFLAILRKAKKETGLVAPSSRYLGADFSLYQNLSWKCSADRDRFLVVNNDGRLMACQEHLTDVDVRTLSSLSDPAWRRAKRNKVNACRGCFYGCYFQKENTGIVDALEGLIALLKA